MKAKIFYWGLYDFANSIVLISFLFYFSQWLVIDQGRPAWWYNASLIVASLLFILTTPFFSARIDKTGKKLGGLRLWTAISVVVFAALALIAALSDSLDLLATALYALGMYAYLMCFLYFTPMLSDLSTPQNRARVSGLGQGMNSLGQVAGLLVTLPFANGALTLLGEPGRAQTLLPAVILFALCALPLLFLYREESRPSDGALSLNNPLALLKVIISHKSLALVLLAYFFFSDALLTFTSNFPLYLEKVWAVSDTLKALLTVAILFLAAVGSPIIGYFADRIGSKKVLASILITYAVLLPALAFAPSFGWVVAICVVSGLLFGPVWGVSRAMIGQLSPPNLTASSYSYYIVAERFATFVGPLVWSGMLLSFGEGPAGYRAGLVAMGILGVIGLFILLRVKDSRVEAAVS